MLLNAYKHDKANKRVHLVPVSLILSECNGIKSELVSSKFPLNNFHASRIKFRMKLVRHNVYSVRDMSNLRYG